MKRVLCLLFWIICGCIDTFAQTQIESGFPAIINFSQMEYDAFRQNWVITQDDRGVIYIGNTNGLLEFDGSKWELYTVPNKSAILGIAYASDKKLYVGAQAELGYFFPNSLGLLTFTSLLNHLPEDKRDFSNVTETYVSQGKVYFNGGKYLLIWDTEKEEFEIIESENGIHLLFNVNGNIYVREWGTGLKVLENGVLRLLEGGEIFANERIYSILPFPDENDALLIGTRTMGLFKFDGSVFTPFKTEIDSFIQENLIYLPGTVLRDGNILLGTLNGGVILMDKEGKEVSRYNLESGIVNNTIYFTFQDQAGGIWLATENGISRIDYSSPISYFDSRSDITTYAHAIIRFDGKIHAATANGVYILDPKTSIFRHLDDLNHQTWAFLAVEDDLLVGTSDGLYKIESEQLIPIKKTVGNEFIINELILSSRNPNRIFIGTNSGIWSMVKQGEDWVEEGQILNVSDQPTSMREDKEGNIWLGTFSNGAFKVSFPTIDDPLNNPIIENYSKENGLQDGIVYAKKINEDMYFVTTDSIYKFNNSENQFFVDHSDDLVAMFYDLGAIEGRMPLTQDFLGRVWLGNKKSISVGEISQEGKWIWNTFPFRRISDESIYALFPEKDGTMWFASGEGFIKYTFEKKTEGNPRFSTFISSVLTGNDSTLFLGSQIELQEVPRLKFKNNRLNFRFTSTSFERKNANQFSTYLEGFDEEWSPWSLETTKAYTNLSPGEYTFKVKSINTLGIESNEASYSFVILSPWFRTWWAYLIYAIVLSAIIYSIVQLRAYYLKKENRILDEKVQHRTRQLNKSLEDLKATQAQLVQSEKMASLGELTAGIAHEIQNPLNFVNNFSEVSGELIEEAQEEIDKGDLEEAKYILQDLKDNLSKINHHGQRAGSIVKGMLEHSRKSDGKKEMTDLNKLADECLRLSFHGFKAKDKSFSAHFNTEFDSSLPKMEVVSQDIGRVLLNLINNAFYASDEKAKKGIEGYKPEVIVSTKKTENGIEISVKDNGNGIPDAIKEKIFQPFFTTKPTGSGTGLGLSLSYDIVKAHGGNLEMDSSQGGTVFTVYLHL